ncbi:hypothetical protein Q5752_006450 [Cryptotrichosporon argae]
MSDPKQDAFASLPTFDATTFEPPAWAQTGFFAPSSSSKRSSPSISGDAAAGPSAVRPGPAGDPGVGAEPNSDDGDDDDDGGDEFVDALEDVDVDAGVEGEFGPETVRFTVPEMRKLLARALELKAKGNAAFTAVPRDLAAARSAYDDALGALPDVPPAPSSAPSPSPTSAPGPASPPEEAPRGIVEVSDDEAAAIVAAATAAAGAAENDSNAGTVEVDERAAVEAEIRDATKQVYQNLGAVFVALGEDAEAVQVCTKALAIDRDYVKALVRRAAANERVGTWTSLSAAQDDHTRLLALLPRGAPQLALSRRALQTLPRRLAERQEVEKQEMLGKLKELGDGILGRFGLSTDMFKFDKGENGGYSMRFEQ